MTEPERLMKKYPELPDDYLEEETRCGFLCSSKRKKIWLVLMDLALELDRLCREEGLRYMLVGGSMLGAVRHQGFIPWDDDMDIAMPRADYEKLKKLGERFREPYFLQIPGEDGGYYYSYMRLRNSRTAAVTPAFAWQDMNMGLAVDIFPLDPWVPEKGEPLYNRVHELCRDNSSFMRRSRPDLSGAELERANSWSGRAPEENLREIETLARSFENEACGYLSHAVITVDKYPNNYFKNEYFTELKRLPFEAFSFPVPAGYDGFLTDEYGDYMSFPPVESRGDKHAEFGLEPEIPYTDYLREMGVRK